ncbi:MAG: AI-2E family transporter [Anaerolineales bacterium]|jgi:predicted PurR-regulated permease PerM
MTQEEYKTIESPSWSGMTKAFVALVVVAVAGGLMLRFHTIIPLLVVAGILAYLILPLVRLITKKTRLSWSVVTNLIFLLMILIVLGASTATGFAIVRQLQALFFTVQAFLLDLPTTLATLAAQPINIGPWAFDLSTMDLSLLAEQALASVQPLLGRVSSLLSSLASVAVESVGRTIFIFAIAYFVTIDYTRVQSRLSNLAIPGYESDVRRILKALTKIWHRFLRGQMLLVLISGVTTWLSMSILGVNFSLGLGVLASIAKFVPILGPLVAGGVAALVALFQPSNWLGVSPITHALLVIIVQIVVDQSLDYLVLPRVLGSSLNIHPVFILVGAIVAASLAGIIGLLLSAPAMATLLLFGRYIYRKMADMSPWDPPIDAFPDPPKRERRWFWKRGKRETKPTQE